jgi:hypothetical protein
MTQNGTVIKTREVSASSVIANESNVTYTFSMKFTHTIPSGGSIQIKLTDSARVSSPSFLTNSCFRLDFSDKPVAMMCKATATTIEVIVSTPAFTSAGL